MIVTKYLSIWVEGVNVMTDPVDINEDPYAKERMAEFDKKRQDRTGLSSVAMTDDEAAAVQKTPNRVTLDSMLKKIVAEEYLRPGCLPHMTICILLTDNGFGLVGKSTPADAGNFDAKLGERFAKEDALRQMWTLEAYLLRERINAGLADLAQ